MSQPVQAGRLDRDAYYMGIAMAVRERANCIGSRVGAVVVLEDRVIATGYNGTPMGMLNCDEGGCERCNDPGRFPTGSGYDVCICVHAEQNTLLTAARFGIAVRGAAIYTTMRPCFGCTKELLQAEISEVMYLHDWLPPEDLRTQYEMIQGQFPHGLRQIRIDDPKADWAMPRGTRQSLGTGHVPPTWA
jgi:dCMP deaminase